MDRHHFMLLSRRLGTHPLQRLHLLLHGPNRPPIIKQPQIHVSLPRRYALDQMKGFLINNMSPHAAGLVSCSVSLLYSRYIDRRHLASHGASGTQSPLSLVTSSHLLFFRCNLWRSHIPRMRSANSNIPALRHHPRPSLAPRLRCLQLRPLFHLGRQSVSHILRLSRVHLLTSC